ncbi:hypothetical protein R5R35_006680 [Gryllus longicercus]
MARKVAEVTAPEGGGGGDGLGPRWQLWRRRRFVLASLAFWGLVSMYSTRINFSVAIVAMTSGSGACHRAALPANASAAANASANASAHAGECSERGEFDWDSRTQGLLLSGFFYGYLASQMPAGWLVARAGAAALLGAGIAGSALLTLLGPVAARVGGAPLLLATRIISGLLQGVVFPCLNAIWARWAPPLERSRLATTVASGCNVGTVIVLPLSGLLAAHVGWPSIFYVFGAGGVLWWALWWAQTADSPERDRRVSEKERRFIEEALGVDTATAKVSFHPWRSFFTSPAYLGKLVAHFCANWGFYTLVTQMPMYLKDTLGFDLRAAGFVSALPYVVMALLLQVAGHTADWLERRQLLNTTHVRKLFLCGAFVLQAGCLLLSTALLDPTAVVACLTLGVALEAFAYAVICVNTLDMAPLHASVLAGVSSTIANTSGILSPQLTGFIVRNKSAAEWRIVFYVTSGLYLLGATAFGIFGSAERQPWAEDGLIPAGDPPAPAPAPADADAKKPSRRDAGHDNAAADVAV